MLVIRQEQMQVLREAMLEQFEERMLAHLRQLFPEKLAKLGEPRARQDIRSGMERAAGYGITSELDTARYIDLMFLIRPDFDTSPETRWAGPVLKDRATPPDKRLSRVQWLARRNGFGAGGAP